MDRSPSPFSRRDLLRAAGLGGLAAAGVAGSGSVAAPAAAASAATTTAATVATAATLGSRLVTGSPGPGGYRPVVRVSGEPHVVRSGVGAEAQSGRATRRRAIAAFAQLSDVHVVDAQSPLRVEWADRVDRKSVV